MTQAGTSLGDAAIARLTEAGFSFDISSVDSADNPPILYSGEKSEDELYYESLDERNEGIDYSYIPSTDSELSPLQETRKAWTKWLKDLLPFADGGIVNNTGPAMLHGTSSKPEMVLDAEQTAMFIGLRNALSKITIGEGSSESINIEKIEIKTDKLNGKQDFDAAGKILANAFGKAIKNRGITTNVRK